VGSIVREDRSVLDLIGADYSYVDERLARHYGVPAIYGSQFRRVTFTGGTRSGGPWARKKVGYRLATHSGRSSGTRSGKAPRFYGAFRSRSSDV